MNKNGILFSIFIGIVSLFLMAEFSPKKAQNFPPPNDNYTTSFTLPFVSETGVVEATIEDQCPIPMKDRVFNYSEIQCVWASIEMIGRWAEEPKLTNPPITSRRDCKSYASPGLAAERLNELGVKFSQSYKDRSRGISLIKRAMAERRGCMFGIPGHAMVMVHYDERANIVKYVNNSDRSLKIQTTTVNEFNEMWDTWVLVIYADNDIIPAKFDSARTLPIHGKSYPSDFIPLPRKELWKK